MGHVTRLFSLVASWLDAFIADARQAGATDTHCVWNQEAD